MKLPLSWLKDFVDVTVTIPQLASRLTMAGLEVEQISFVGTPLPMVEGEDQSGTAEKIDINISGLYWLPALIS